MAKQLPESFVTRQRWSAAEARIVLDALARSRLSIPAFSEREGLDVQRVRRWAHRIGTSRERSVAAEPLPRFVEVPHMAAALVEVVLRSGRVLRVPESIAPSVLRRLADALDESEGSC
jgi:hypothetical protein